MGHEASWPACVEDRRLTDSLPCVTSGCDIGMRLRAYGRPAHHCDCLPHRDGLQPVPDRVGDCHHHADDVPSDSRSSSDVGILSDGLLRARGEGKAGLDQAGWSDGARRFVAAGLSYSFVEDQCSDERGMEEEQATTLWLRLHEVGGATPWLVVLTASISVIGNPKRCNSQKILLTEARIGIGAPVEDANASIFPLQTVTV